MKINFVFNEEIKFLFKIFNFNGQNNLKLVGGAIRNYILKQPIKDYDFATILSPNEMINILEKNNIKYIDLAKQYGTITAILNGISFEITTLRLDIDTNGRKADVNFTDSYTLDAKRRDFTFNAMYLDEKKELYDYFNGLVDLNKRIVRFIGDAETRIQEDYLRILRFFRFFSSYGFFFDYKSLQNCIIYKTKLNLLSRERIKSEFIKILNSNDFYKTIFLMDYYHFFIEILNIDNLNLYNLGIFFYIKEYIKFEFNELFNLVLILSINPQPNIQNILKLSNKEAKFINDIVKYANTNINELNIKKLLFQIKDKIIVKNIVIVSLVNNLQLDYINKINGDLSFIDNEKIIELPITIEDLKNNSLFKKNQYNFLLKKANEYFLINDLNVSKHNILDYLYNFA